MVAATLMPRSVSSLPSGAGTCGPVAQPLAALMRELVSLLGSLSPEQYTARTGRLFSDGSIGGHVRHCLDHARALADGLGTGEIDYDHRARGTPIETDVAAAATEAARLLDVFASLSGRASAHPLHILVIAERGGPALALASTLGRELAFVLSHTIHHNAIIRAMALSLGAPVPDTLGYAPATLTHMDAHACARSR